MTIRCKKSDLEESHYDNQRIQTRRNSGASRIWNEMTITTGEYLVSKKYKSKNVQRVNYAGTKMYSEIRNREPRRWGRTVRNSEE